MEFDTTLIAAIIGGILVGFIVAKLMEKGKASKTIGNAKKEAATIIKDSRSEGESIKKDKILQAKEKFLELKAEHEKVIINKNKKIAEAEKRTRDKEWLTPSLDRIIYDVGGAYNSDNQIFDHHQRPGPLRDDGKPFSSFGLIWKHYGKQYLSKMAIPVGQNALSIFKTNLTFKIICVTN